jgi:transposase-like protein
MVMTTPKTLTEAIRFFSTYENCKEFMVARRWPDGVTCPSCGSKSVYYDSGRKGWECKTRHPKRKFTLKTGTIFEDSPLGLDKWLPAVWMIANMKNGVSSHELARSLGVTQKTAWFMLHRIRLAMQDDSGDRFGGQVEADETFIGGRARFMHADKRERLKGRKGRSTMGKVAVAGLLERHGEDGHSRVHTKVVPNTRRYALLSEIRDRVKMADDTTLITDAHGAYNRPVNWGRPGTFNYVHKVIDHAEAYAIGAVHTNGMENYWSLLKRMIKGTYVSVEPFHLFRYLDEQALRFNLRKRSDADRFTEVLKGIVGKRVMYTELTAALAGSSPV